MHAIIKKNTVDEDEEGELGNGSKDQIKKTWKEKTTCL